MLNLFKYMFFKNSLTSLIMMLFLLSSCTSKKQLTYLGDADSWVKNKINLSNFKSIIEIGDILKIDVQSIVPEAAIVYNLTVSSGSMQNLELLKLEGYLVDNSGFINFPVLGKINVSDLSTFSLEKKLTSLLSNGEHLKNPSIKVRRVNSKFTVLGEVRNPGTFSFYDEKLNLLQALGYAGDLTVDGKRNDLSLIREENGYRTVYKVELTKSDLLNKSIYQIKNNDVIIVNPSYSKVKSAGFIGSPGSIASMASILLSITLLIINN